MKKIIIGLLLVVIVVVGGGILYIDKIAKAAVETGGEQAMGVKTSLDDISVGIFSGQLKLAGLEVANPQGFKSPHFFKLGKGEVEVSLGTLMKDKIVAPKLHLDGIDVHLEKSDSGANYEAILNHMKKGETQKTPEPEAKDGKKFVINEVVISNVTVHADVAIAGQKIDPVEVKIDEIRLKDVGSDTDSGVLLSELMSKLTQATLQALLKQGPQLLPQAIFAGLGVGMQGLGDVTKMPMDIIGNVTKTVGGQTSQMVDGALKQIGGDLNKQIENATKPIQKELGGALKKLGGALGGQKEKKK